MQNITHIEYLTSTIEKPCVECDEGDNLEFDKQINHYLAHGYKLLHTGPETTYSDGEGHFWYRTVAVMGKE